MDEAAGTLIVLGALMLFGLVADAWSRRLGIPTVTILIIAGVAAGPEALGVLPPVGEIWFPLAATLALTMVGFLLGGRFTSDTLREEGRTELAIAASEGVVTAAVVTTGLLLVGVDVVLALCLGGIAVATAPAATLAVIDEQRADGPFTRLLTGVVALDDIFALTLFGFLAALASVFAGEGSGTSLLGSSLWEIGGAIGLGVVLGVPAASLTGRIRPGRPTREEAYGLVLLCAGLAIHLGVSHLLAAVVMGMTIANRAPHHDVPFSEIERIEWPALVVFFVLAGASLEISVLSEVGWLGVGYVLLRAAGKTAGCALGARAARLPDRHRRWFGAAMLPQAGVAIGLSLLAADRFPEVAERLLAVVIAGTVVFELVGPVMAKVALDQVGEVGAISADSMD